jgi:hypothetical protein
MKRLFNYALALTLGLILMSGTALAWNATEHVTVSPNGKGDSGIFPIYVALQGGWETKLEIINTSLSYSTVAKVVVRTARYSQEVLDFFIFLSPADVWTGYLNFGPSGARLYSTDDSVHAGTRASGPLAIWASVDDPMNVLLYDDPCDDNTLGYVEVMESWHAVIAPGEPGVDKDDIEAAWNANNPPAGIGTLNSLAMHYEVNYAPLFNAAERAVVFRDYDVTEKLTLGAETFFGSEAGSLSRNSLCEVEAALAKDEIAMPYYANNSDFTALHILLFPTKYTLLDVDCTIDNVKSPFFQDNSSAADDWCIEFGLYFWDLEENSPTPQGAYSPVPPGLTYEFCNELNLLSPDAIATLGFDEGWIAYEFDTITTCTPESSVADSINFQGAPVVPVTLLVEGTGMSLVNGAWTDSFVWYNTVFQQYYHYGPYPNALSVPAAAPAP